MSGRTTYPIGHSGASQSYHSVSPVPVRSISEHSSATDISPRVPTSARPMSTSSHSRITYRHSGASQSYHSVSPVPGRSISEHSSATDISPPVPTSSHSSTPQPVLVSASIVQSSKQAGEGRPSVAKTYSYKGVEYTLRTKFLRTWSVQSAMKC